MLIFSCSDKGGTGRSVTSCNLAHRLSLLGRDVAYLDFDFGSPTAGAIFEIPKLERGTRDGGLHAFIQGEVSEPTRVDIRRATERFALQERPPGSGKLALFPGDAGGAEFREQNTPEQGRWVVRSDDHLKALAKSRGLGQDLLAGTTPLEPMLLWREQVIMDLDVNRRLARPATAQAFDKLASKVVHDQAWEAPAVAHARRTGVITVGTVGGSAARRTDSGR